MKTFWNERYGQEDFAYGREANVFFAEELIKMKPGHVLLPAEGEGRNAVYAARHGWKVTALDYSESGRQKAQQLAANSGVDLTYEVVDILEYDYPKETYDAAALIYCHVPKEKQGALLDHVYAALKPGGTLIMEVFHHEQIGNPSGGPKTTDLLYHEDDLKDHLKNWEVVQLEHIPTELMEGQYHQGPAEVVRVIARKPA
jgi:cyclopropane fatty-acyl-phospholipid synthase-like methyltransferase